MVKLLLVFIVSDFYYLRLCALVVSLWDLSLFLFMLPKFVFVGCLKFVGFLVSSAVAT